MASKNSPEKQALFNRLVKPIMRFQDFQACSNNKPYWASHLSDRTWRRHSALLTSQHEMAREDNHV